MSIVFWATIVVLGVLGLLIAAAVVVDGLADALLPNFLKKKDPVTGAVTRTGTFASFAKGLGKWWAMLAMLGGIMTLLIWARTDAGGLSILIPIILLSIGGTTMLWSYGLNRLVQSIAKSRALSAITLSSILLACVLFAAFVLNPNAGWYPVQVRILGVLAADGKTAQTQVVVPTPSGGFFKASDVFGEVALRSLKTTTGTAEGVVLLDAGLAPHIPGYDLKYEPVKNTPYTLSYIKESWKGGVQDSYARKGVREYRSVAELADAAAPGPKIGPRISMAPERTLSPPEAPKRMSLFWPILATLPLLGILFWWAIQRPAAGDRVAWGILTAIAAVLAIYVWNLYFTPPPVPYVPPTPPPVTEPADPPPPHLTLRGGEDPNTSGLGGLGTTTSVPRPPTGPVRLVEETGENHPDLPVMRDSGGQQVTMDHDVASGLFDRKTSKEIVDGICADPTITTPSLRQAAGCAN